MTLQKILSDKYEKGTPIVPDEVFDTLYEGVDMGSKGDVKLPIELYSLKKQWGTPEFGKYSESEYVKTPKLDGVALLLEYGNGYLQNVYTRGNGEYGTRISRAHYDHIDGLVRLVPTKDVFYVTGEIVLPHSVKNARNVVAGYLGLDIPEYRGDIQFIAYSVIGLHLSSYIEDMSKLHSLGFSTVLGSGLDIYPTDGEVYRLNSNTDFKEAGHTSKYPRGAFALKQQAEAKETTILDIVWQTGKTGRITPVAIMEPVEMDDGATVSRASLANVAIYREMKPMVGDTASVIRSGGIIPYITGVKGTTPFADRTPTVCPECCSTNLELSDTGLLTCMNPECSAKAEGILINHCKKLRMKGFGPAAVRSLVDNGIDSIQQLYETSREQFEEFLLSEKIAGKLYEEIQRCRVTTLDRAIASLGIPLIGDTASKKLSVELLTLSDLRSITAGKIKGIGKFAVRNIKRYVSSNPGILEFLDNALEISTVREKNGENGVVCITGKVAGYTKAQVSSLLEDKGYTVVSTVTKACTIVISEDGKQSSKLKQAQDRGLLITTLNNLID